MIAGACSTEPDRSVRIDRNADSYALRFRIDRFDGHCYAPQSIVFNGYLSLEEIKGVDRWVAMPADPGQIEELGGILSSKRVKIGRSDIILSVPKDAVVKRPFNVQFVVFPCDAPRAPKGKTGAMHIVSIAADLPPFEVGRPDAR
jgi:hypothetical protein